MFNTAIILAGGLGSRLRPFTDDLPKPMVEVAPNIPFIQLIIEHLHYSGIGDIVILGGYKSEAFNSLVARVNGKKEGYVCDC